MLKNRRLALPAVAGIVYLFVIIIKDWHIWKAPEIIIVAIVIIMLLHFVFAVLTKKYIDISKGKGIKIRSIDDKGVREFYKKQEFIGYGLFLTFILIELVRYLWR